jgi:hypothetical protein
MKRLFDVMCTNEDCKEHGEAIEVLIHEGDFPGCKECGEVTGITILKTPSVLLRGGTSGGYQNDGWLNVGNRKDTVRRKDP